MDSVNDLERELTAALQVEPSTGFARRVRACIANAADAPQWRVPRLASVAGALVLTALAANLLSRPPRSAPHGASVLPTRSVALIVPLRAAPPSIPPDVGSPQRRDRSTDVFVSRDEILALQRLFSGLVVAPPATAPVEALAIPTLALDALSVPAIPEGGGK